MSSELSDSDSVDGISAQSNVKKRKKAGKMSDVMKKLRATTHEVGDDCKCFRFKCFEVVSSEERQRIITNFNQLGEYNAQNQYLSGLITVVPVQRRRNRKDESEASFHSSSYCYRVRAHVDGTLQDVSVCHKAFISLHGITNRRVQTLKKHLTEFGECQADGRGKHANRPNELSEETKSKVLSFIKSLKGRKSHYSLKDTSKVYLPEELDKSKLHRMYCESNKENPVGLTTFRDILDSNFNFSFGYPRKDTCSNCDLLKAEISVLEEKITMAADEETKESLKQTLLKKEKDKKVHLARSTQFYSIKRKYRKESRKKEEIEAITVDFQKNLPTPNITTSDVYYRRQLNFISFNVHILSDSTSVFYTYDESIARKGADDVCSMLEHFFNEVLSSTVRQIIIFCDSCAGQNKNYTVMRFFHYMVHNLKRFDSVKVVFPIRGHSYMEGDKDMSLVNAKSYAETPDDWRDVLRNSRLKPSPFTVINCDTDVKFQTWTDFLSGLYVRKCPMPTRPVRILKIDKEHTRLIFHKANYFGGYLNAVVKNRNEDGEESKQTSRHKKKSEPKELKKLYEEKLPLKPAKLKDLLHLKQFLTNPDAQAFYEALIPDQMHEGDGSDIEYVDDPPIDDAP